jgi:hypothetical protein
MKTTLRRWVLAVLAIGLMGLFAVLAGCASSGEVEVGVYGVDYYEPYGYNYGHWHPGYHVAPPRGGREDRDRQASGQSRPAPVQAQPPPVQSRPSPPAYRPAPPSRPAPSIPSKPRERKH